MHILIFGMVHFRFFGRIRVQLVETVRLMCTCVGFVLEMAKLKESLWDPTRVSAGKTTVGLRYERTVFNSVFLYSPPNRFCPNFACDHSSTPSTR